MTVFNASAHRALSLRSHSYSLDAKSFTMTSSLQDLLAREDWTGIQYLLEDHPELARLPNARLQCFGERTLCLPLHACLARPNPCLDLLEKIVAIYPGALTVREGRHGRGPLHLACLKRLASVPVARYICKIQPECLLQQDDQGNTPLHYACQYAPETVCRVLLQAGPRACQIPNHRGLLPIHLLCSWDNQQSLQFFRDMLHSYPACVTVADRNERLPLHSACDSQEPRQDVIALLVDCHPAALLAKDKFKKKPVSLLKRSKGPMVEFLQIRTTKEKRKQSTLDKLFTIRPSCTTLDRLFTIRVHN